jgi:hypothetical protein
MAEDIVLRLENIIKSFKGTAVLDGVSFNLHKSSTGCKQQRSLHYSYLFPFLCFAHLFLAFLSPHSIILGYLALALTPLLHKPRRLRASCSLSAPKRKGSGCFVSPSQTSGKLKYLASGFILGSILFSGLTYAATSNSISVNLERVKFIIND